MGTLDNATREACFSVQIIDDMEFEDEIETFSIVIESFTVINVNEDGKMLRVASSPRRIDVKIADNDRDIVIGFEESELSVNEGGSLLELCVVVFRPTAGEDLNAIINVIVSTVSDTAGISVAKKSIKVHEC